MAVFFDIETTGLNPYEHQITIIGMKAYGKISFWKSWDSQDEVKAIQGAVTQLGSITDTIVGFNNLKFDVPFIIKRLETQGHPPSELWWLYNKKWFDLYQFCGDDFRSQKYWLDKAGIKEEAPQLKGKDMPEAFKNKEYSKIERHITSDLNMSEALFHYFKEKNPDFLRFA